MDDDTMQVATQNAMMMIALDGINFVMALGFLAVALTLVRKVNRAASGLMAAAACISLLLTFAHPLASVALHFFIGTESSNAALLSANGAISTLTGLVHVAAALLQLVGIVKLAQGAGADRVRGDS